jgi:hypothetical protein
VEPGTTRIDLDSGYNLLALPFQTVFSALWTAKRGRTILTDTAEWGKSAVEWASLAPGSLAPACFNRFGTRLDLLVLL